jgi:DNA processing protein
MVPGDNSTARLPTTPIMATNGLEMVVRDDPRFPTRLLQIPRPPKQLWVSGGLPDPRRSALAIVGSRKASGAGCERARELAAAFARRGWVIVSGGAFGIDAAAHEGALEAGAETYAVLGCGVDVIYPDRHRKLFARITGQGGLLSEYAPGTQPRAGQFPVRNRIIAGLADAVLVVEAAHRSGALSTAHAARKAGQRLLAVPGTAGTDALITAGALAVTSAATVEDALAGRAPVAAAPPVPNMFSALVEALGAKEDSAPGLARRLGLSLPAVMGLLLEAELEGWVRRRADSHYEVLRGH